MVPTNLTSTVAVGADPFIPVVLVPSNLMVLVPSSLMGPLVLVPTDLVPLSGSHVDPLDLDPLDAGLDPSGLDPLDLGLDCPLV